MWKEFRIAVSFLTRLPLNYKGEWDERSFSRSTVFYPFVGLITGFLVTVVAVLAMKFTFPALAAVLALVTGCVVSGGIHLDGFMDMCDGIFASRGRERALEIMKDSHVGSFAVLGVILLLLLKFVLYSHFVTKLDSLYILTFLAAFTFSRYMMDIAILVFPSARESGLGATVKKYVSKPALLWGLILMIAVSGVYLKFFPLIIAFVAALAVMLFIAWAINRFLHGLTGDIYGAIAELGEVVYLLILCFIA